MSIKKTLKLLDKSKLFEVDERDGGYDVSFKDDCSDYPLSAYYSSSDGSWSFYVGGVYNNGTDWARIETGRLKTLMGFCESLGGDSE